MGSRQDRPRTPEKASAMRVFLADNFYVETRVTRPPRYQLSPIPVIGVKQYSIVVSQGTAPRPLGLWEDGQSKAPTGFMIAPMTAPRGPKLEKWRPRSKKGARTQTIVGALQALMQGAP